MIINRLLYCIGSLLLLTWIAGCGKQADNSLPWLATDVGPRLHVIGKSAHWDARSRKLGKSGFSANVGFCRYTNPIDGPGHYSIDVEFAMVDSSRVCFQRDIALGDLPKQFNGDDIDTIVNFNEDTRLVTFNIGDVVYKYTLPSPP